MLGCYFKDKGGEAGSTVKAARLVYTQLVYSCPSCPRRESRHTRQARRQDAFTYAASSIYRTATAGVIGSALRFGQVITLKRARMREA